MQGLFITGTDTDVGKTYVSALIVRHLRQMGIAVAARKPIASGCIDVCADAQQLAHASQEDEHLVCPYQFSTMCSPARAITIAQSSVRLTHLIQACQPQPHQSFTLVEGAGGWLSPLTPDASNADLAIALNLPVLIVVNNTLGCINHTRLTLSHITQLGLSCMGIVLNNITHNTDPDCATELASLIDIPIWSLAYHSNSLEISFIKACQALEATVQP